MLRLYRHDQLLMVEDLSKEVCETILYLAAARMLRQTRHASHASAYADVAETDVSSEAFPIRDYEAVCIHDTRTIELPDKPSVHQSK